MKSCADNGQAYLQEFHGILDSMILGMTRAGLTCSVSQNFIAQMIPHHRAAINMSRSLLRHSGCEPVRRIAESIITEQTKSIESMCAVLGACTEHGSSAGDLRQYRRQFRDTASAMFAEMRTAYTSGCVSRDFMRQMIPHHRGAIRMSKSALQFPICSALHPILGAIISSQSEGICEMESLLGEP